MQLIFYIIILIMNTILIAALIVVGIIFMACVLLMSPKGWLGFGIGGAGGSNEYGSKKSIEYTLKKVATVTGILFVLISLALPFVK